MTPIPSFSDFFQALWSHSSFPWQRLLADRLMDGLWPRVLDLPTAAGKTACLDIAIHALAAQADKPVWERTAPRRIWFVVDRRIVVDEAHERARQIAEKLQQATEGPLKVIADRLRVVSGTERPLATARLRGGVLRDDGWARLPSQPAVITSTVDQLGSQLLFRGYGHSARTAPIFAGLAAHDSLILLDEAHLSVPFLQTLHAVDRFRGERWAEQPIRTPFTFAMLSATPPADVSLVDVFPGPQRDAALDHPVLRQRMQAAKPAELVEVKAKKTSETEPLVAEASTRARHFVDAGKQRTAVVVNRVATAQAISRLLRDGLGDQADIVLFTGRLRPLERDLLVQRWQPKLRANRPEEPEKPLILVATQCIEVGADFSFDALVTEAASLDALRQRFGRLNRLGSSEAAPAAVLIRVDEAREAHEDIVYGSAMTACWQLLNDLAATKCEGDTDRKTLDFGIAALDQALTGIDDLTPYLAPAPDAPLLFPAHLDLLCQTSPMPNVQPDVELYLHGVGRGEPEVHLVWRTDLNPADTRIWQDTVALCPPNSLETLSVPLSRLRRWLAEDAFHEDAPDLADLEGAACGEQTDPAGSRKRMRPVLAWRGRERSKVIDGPAGLHPDDLIVLPADYGMEGLGQSSPEQVLGKQALDIWEPSHGGSGKLPALRLNGAVLKPWLNCPPLAELVELAGAPDWDENTLQLAIDAVLDYVPVTDNDPPAPPDWLGKLLVETRAGKKEQHPAGGLILFASMDRKWNTVEQDLFADDDDLLSAIGREVPLSVHSALVERAVEQLAGRCLPVEFHQPLTTAAYWHDAGKLDERFQVWLRQGDELALYSGEPLAKSKDIANSPARRRQLREASGLPENFRHEMLSLQLAERLMLPSGNEILDDLALYCIASHHGHGRPFAPFSPDDDPPPVTGMHDGVAIDIAGAGRAEWPLPHALDSGIPERFWRLTRRYGWWGLAYLEAILRLGDWYGSRFTDEAVVPRPQQEATRFPNKSAEKNNQRVLLAGIDGANPLGFLAALGTVVVLHQSGYMDVRLAWQRGTSWRPELSGLPVADPREFVALIASNLRGASILEEPEGKRKQAEKRLAQAKKCIKDKKDEIKQRGLRGRERQQAMNGEVAPLERERDLLNQAFLKALCDAVPKPELALGENIDCDANVFRELAHPFLREADWHERETVDMLAAFTSDACLHDSQSKRRKGKLAPTPFSFISGGGHQDFLGTVRQLLALVTPENLTATLFNPWVYADDGLSMRWDPMEDRRYALMDRDPTASGNKPRTVWMANLLAYRALVLFTTAPRHYGLAATAWSKHDGADAFSWPLWEHPSGPDTIRSFFLLPEMHIQRPDQASLKARGIQAVFRSRRIKVGEGANFKINFAPARQI